ncbi:MAG: TolC family protein [Gemmatimonadota bacterium]|nr:TolC family protein [Gemmatimonadota bacterium]
MHNLFRHRATLALLALACVSATTRAQSAPRVITLQQAIEMAERQGLPAIAALSTRQAARARDNSFFARRMPQVTLGIVAPSYDRSILPIVQPDGSTSFTPLQRTDASVGMTLSQPLPFTGGLLSVTSSIERLRYSGANSSQTWTSNPITVRLSQGLFRPNALKWDRREEDLRLDFAERQFLEAREDIAIFAANAFFDLYAAKTGLANAVVNVAVNDTLYTLNKGRYEVGKIGENDLLQSELALLRARSSLDGAKLEYDRSLSALRLAINVPNGTPLAIIVPSTIPTFDPDTARAVSEALKNRSQLADYSLQEVQARRHINDARLNNGLGATVEASMGFNSTAPEFNTAYNNLLQAQRFALGVSVPLVQWGVRGAEVQAAQADQRRVEALTRSGREQSAQDAKYAALQLSQAQRNVSLSAKADTVGTKRFEVAYNRYVIGKIGIDNLYLAQSEKDQALLQYVAALRGYWAAYYRLRRLTLYDFELNSQIR